MNPRQLCLRWDTWKKKPCILLSIVVITSTSMLLATPSPALATSSNEKNPLLFGGYIATPQGKSMESAEANFTMPTLTCSDKSDRALLITQEVDYEGLYTYAEAFVMAECDSGTAMYNAEAVSCGVGGCNSSSGCLPRSAPVSPGDSITLREQAFGGNDGFAGAGVNDNTNGNAVGCQVPAPNPYPQPGPVETGMCPALNIGENAPSSSNAPQNPYCNDITVPRVSPVKFTGVTVDGKALGHWNPKRYDYAAGTRLELKSGNLKDGGESFKMSHVQP
jgi:hypothetical protein